MKDKHHGISLYTCISVYYMKIYEDASLIITHSFRVDAYDMTLIYI